MPEDTFIQGEGIKNLLCLDKESSLEIFPASGLSWSQEWECLLQTKETSENIAFDTLTHFTL